MYRFDPYAEPTSLGFLQFINETPNEERWPTIPRPRMLDVLFRVGGRKQLTRTVQWFGQTHAGPTYRQLWFPLIPPGWDLWKYLHPAEWHVLAVERIRDLSQTVVQHVGQVAPGFSQRNPHEWTLLAAPINRDYFYFLFPHGICLVADERVRVRSENRLHLLEDRALIEPQPFSVPHLGEDVPKAIWESYRCAMRELEPPRLPLRGA
ncbi:hypothetical protein HYZ80_04055 [Candidatus Parcubacteria bacterium]|nr:hypothetical protein [Candidatus Parcubacteria bacterium]